MNIQGLKITVEELLESPFTTLTERTLLNEIIRLRDQIDFLYQIQVELLEQAKWLQMGFANIKLTSNDQKTEK